MKLQKLMLLILTIILFVSCNNGEKVQYKEPVFEEQITGNVKFISKDLPLKSIFGIEELDEDKIIVLGLIEDKFINIFSKNDGKLLHSYITLGRANQELTFIDSYNLNREEKILTIFCRKTMRLITLNLNDDKLGQIKVEEISKKIPKFTSSAFLMNNKALCFSDMYCNLENVNRLSLISDEVDNVFNNKPIEDDKLSAKAYSQVSFKVSPDNSRFAIGTVFGAILESYVIRNDKIKNLNISYFLELKKDVSLKDMLFGFSDIAVSNDFIYTGYCGTNDLSKFNKLAIFDWKCKPIKLVDFDKINISRLCVGQQNEIYAIVAGEDNSLNIANLIF